MMKHSYRFNELKSELVQVGCIKREKQRLTFLAGTTVVERLSAELKKRLLSVKELKQITLLDTDSIEWSLILGSGYNVSQAAARGKLTKLCCTVINETNERDMRSRAKLLRLTCAASLYRGSNPRICSHSIWGCHRLFYASAGRYPAAPDNIWWIGSLPGCQSWLVP